MQEHQFQKPPRRQMPGLTAVDLQLAPPTAVTDGPVETGDRTIQLFPRSPVIVPQLTKNLSVFFLLFAIFSTLATSYKTVLYIFFELSTSS